jgi:glyoxylate reductase
VDHVRIDVRTRLVKIAVTGPVPQPAIDQLLAAGATVVQGASDTLPVAELHQLIAGCDAVMTLLTAKVDDAFLDAAGPQLKIVANIAVGFNNVDVAACARRGVTVTNTPGVLTDATADIAMALILMSTRRLGEGERIIRSGAPWQWGMMYHLGASIQGARLGIVGMGAIGKALARRAEAFGMTIAYSNRNRLTDTDALYLGLDELFESSDIVSLHCPYSPDTHHLVDARRLALMKPSAFLINTARGPVVDEAALSDALARGVIAGAGLDVFENEPAVHPGLLTQENAVLIPHLGSATLVTRTAMATLAARNALAVLSGASPLTPVPGSV